MNQVMLFLIDDVHLEHRSIEMKQDFAVALNKKIEKVKDDNISPILIAAGDIDEGLAGLEWLKQFKCPIIYTCGNHEFWNHDYFEVLHNLSKKVTEPGYEHIQFLYNKETIVEGIRFIGGSLWTNMGANWPWWGHNKIIQNFNGMPDFKKIQANSFYNNKDDVQELVTLLTNNLVPEDKIAELINKKLFNPLLQLRENKKTFNFIKNTLSVPYSGQTVVVTHHLPVVEHWMRIVGMKSKSLSPEKINDKQLYVESIEKRLPRSKNVLMMGFYVNDFKNDFFNLETSPDLWVHGHLHQSVDSYMGKTRVASSPVGHFKADAGEQELKIKEVLIGEFGARSVLRDYMIDTFEKLDLTRVNNLLDNFQNMITSFDIAVNNGMLMSTDFQPVIEVFEKDLTIEMDNIKEKIAEVLDAYIITNNIHLKANYDKGYYIVSRLSGMHHWLKRQDRTLIPLVPDYYSTEISFQNNIEETEDNKDKLASNWLVGVESFKSDLNDFKEGIVAFAKQAHFE